MVTIKRPSKKILEYKSNPPGLVCRKCGKSYSSFAAHELTCVQSTDPNKEKDLEKTNKILDTKKTPQEKAKKVSKVVTIHISVGDEDRDRTIEQFIEDLLKVHKSVPYGEPGMHAMEMGAYYILDGVVCLPRDYDHKRQQFLPGHFPPPWAGGPVVHSKQTKTDITGGKYDRKTLSAREYDEKYKGKGNPHVIKPLPPDELMEDIDWDDSDIGNEKEAKKVASSATKNAKRILRIKHPHPAPAPIKKVIRRKAK